MPLLLAEQVNVSMAQLQVGASLARDLLHCWSEPCSRSFTLLERALLAIFSVGTFLTIKKRKKKKDREQGSLQQETLD